MARKRGPLDFKNEAEEVACRFKTEKTLWKKERLQAIKLLLETEMSYVEVASIVGRDPSRLSAWAKLFREGGLAKLLVRGNGGGRKPLMSPQIEALLIEKLRTGTFRTAGQILHWLKEEHQLEYGKDSIYYVLGKLGWHLKGPLPCHQKKTQSMKRLSAVSVARSPSPASSCSANSEASRSCVSRTSLE